MKSLLMNARMLAAVMKRRWLYPLLLVSAWLATGAASGYQPSGPVKIVVYTGPGGLLDTTARRFADIARQYVDATFVVENRPGAGGLVAMDTVRHAAPDGRTLLAVTKSNMAKIMLASREDLLEAFDWRAMLVAETECLIVRADSSLHSLEDLVNAGRAAQGKQVWLGPASGGLDHVTAAKVWRAFEFRGRWIPFFSGNEALSALLGGQGQVYVGNPSDAIENPLLRIIAISSPQRLTPFPAVPVFAEYGATDLDQQFMWRGFALPRGCSPEILAWYDRLFQQVAADPKWKSLWEEEGASAFYRPAVEFQAQVQADAREFAQYHRELGLAVEESQRGRERFPQRIGWALLVFVGACWMWALRRASLSGGMQASLLPLVVQSLALGLYWQTLSYPEGVEVIGAASIPRLWLSLLILVAPFTWWRQRDVNARSSSHVVATPASPEPRSAGTVIDLEESPSNVSSIGWFLMALLSYVGLLSVMGYLLATLVWMVGASWLLGHRRWPVSLAVALAWVSLTYVGFERWLSVTLPRGWLNEWWRG